MQPSHGGRSSAGLRDGGRLHEAVLPMGNLLEEVFRRRWLLTAAITYHPAQGRGSTGKRRRVAHGYKLFITNHTGYYYYYAAQTYTTVPPVTVYLLPYSTHYTHGPTHIPRTNC